MANDDMQVVAIMTRKGGAGKTALVRAFISAVLSEGKTCLGVDADPQQALRRWGDRVQGSNPNLRVVTITQASEFSEIVEGEYEAGTADYIFLDTQGVGGDWADDYAIHADHVVVPIMLTPTDFDISMDTVRWYRRLHERADDPETLPKLSVVLARVDRSPSKTMKKVARDIDGELRGRVVPDMFMERKQHADADQEGLLHDIAAARRKSLNPLMRGHARHFEEALQEAKDILAGIEGAT